MNLDHAAADGGSEGPLIPYKGRSKPRPAKKKAPARPSSPHWPTWNERWNCIERRLKSLEERIDELETERKDAARKISPALPPAPR